MQDTQKFAKRRGSKRPKDAAEKARRRQWDSPSKKPKPIPPIEVESEAAPPLEDLSMRQISNSGSGLASGSALTMAASPTFVGEPEAQVADLKHESANAGDVASRTAPPAEDLSQLPTTRRKSKVYKTRDQDSDQASEVSDGEYKPGPEVIMDHDERVRAQRRKASAKYYARHPEIREKKRLQMAEKRAAIKARRRQWDPPKKPKPPANPIEAESGAAPSLEDDSSGGVPSSRTLTASASQTFTMAAGHRRRPGVDVLRRESANIGNIASRTAAPIENLQLPLVATASLTSAVEIHSARHEDADDIASRATAPTEDPSELPMKSKVRTAQDQRPDQGSNSKASFPKPGQALERDERIRAQRRKASAKYYARHPEVREKKRLQMAERRAAIKARRRQWDPPKKSKKPADPIELESEAAPPLEDQVDSDYELIPDDSDEEDDVVWGDAPGSASLNCVYSWAV
ncbi:hypothetical protein K438DRAFT_57055 [Mycena galopus ATCC 62051]|nr:hypothetical protein K438DRAFT_57055 [Mycena galopus ATCC 62051]